MHLIQIFLPLHDNHGKAFPPEHYLRMREALTTKYGGRTINGS